MKNSNLRYNISVHFSFMYFVCVFSAVLVKTWSPTSWMGHIHTDEINCNFMSTLGIIIAMLFAEQHKGMVVC